MRVWSQPALTFGENTECGGEHADAIHTESREWQTDR